MVLWSPGRWQGVSCGRRVRAVRLLLLALWVSLGCRAPSEEALTPIARRAPRDGGAPLLDDDALRARVAAVMPAATVRRVPQMAPMDAVIARVTLANGDERAVAVDARAVTEGIAGAERVLRSWSALGYEPFAEDLVRVVGLFARPAATVYAARTVVEVAGTPRWTVSPSLAPRAGGNGRTLVFSYVQRGEVEAMHVGRFHLTAGGMVIDEAPLPTDHNSSLTGRAAATDNPLR